MKKIINWTFGSVFRTLGRVLTYLALGGLIAFICAKNDIKITQLFGIETIHAAELSPLEVKKFYVADVTDSIINPDQQWSSAIDWGTEYNRTSETSLFLRSVRVRAGYSSKFLKGVTYKFKVNVIFSNSTNGYFYKLPESIICQGSGTSSWSSDTDLISSCKFVGREFYNNKANASYIFEFVPAADIYGVQIAWYYKLPVYGNFDMYFANVGKIRVLNSSKITYNNSTNDAINSMSDNITINQNKNTEEIINNQNQNTQEIINNQNEMLGNKCSNILDLNNYSVENYNNTFEKDKNYIKIHASGTWSNVRFKNIKVEKNTTYYLKMKYSKDFDYYSLIGIYQNDSNNTIIREQYFNERNGSIDINFNTGNNEYIRIGFFGSTGDYSTTQNIFYNEIILSKENKPYCETGSFQSKLDDTNNAINNLNDTLTDDNISDSDVSNSLNYNVSENSFGPFSTFLTLPLTWVQNILASSQSCNTINIPLPYMNNKYLTLPCMTPFWNRLGLLGDLIYALWLCVVGVRIFNGLFLITVEATSTEGNAEELYKLQSWEL